MKQKIVQRRMRLLSHSRPDRREQCPHRLGRGAQNRGFVIDNRENTIRTNEPDTQEHERHYLPCNFIRLAGTDRHFQSWLGRKGKPAHALSSPRLSRTMSRASCVRSEEHTSELQSRVDLVCRL